MVRFFIKLVVWVTLARWMYAEAQLVTPSAVPFINAAMTRLEIPTHDKWRSTELGQYLEQRLPTSASLRQQISSNIDLPIKHSAGVLDQATSALSLSGRSDGFTKF